MDAVELIRSGKVQLVVNTPRGRGPRADGAHIRRAAHQYKVPLVTTVAAARAAAAGVLERARQPFTREVPPGAPRPGTRARPGGSLEGTVEPSTDMAPRPTWPHGWAHWPCPTRS